MILAAEFGPARPRLCSPNQCSNNWRLRVHLYPRELAVWEDVFGGDLVRLADGHHLIRKVFVGDIAISILVKAFEERLDVAIECIDAMRFHYLLELVDRDIVFVSRWIVPINGFKGRGEVEIGPLLDFFLESLDVLFDL